MYKPKDNISGSSNFSIPTKGESKANREVNPYPYTKPPVTDTLSVLTDEHALSVFGNIPLLDKNEHFGLENVDDLIRDLGKLKKFLKGRNGSISNISAVVRDCSLALENGKCEDITKKNIAAYSKTIREALTNQGIPVSSNFAIGSVERKPQKVYGMMEVSIPIELEITYSYTPKDEDDKLEPVPDEKVDPKPENKIKRKGKDDEIIEPIPEPEPGEKVLKIIERIIKGLEEEVTYTDPITRGIVTRKGKDTLYGVWYMGVLLDYRDRLTDDIKYRGIVKSRLWGVPNYVSCYDKSAFGNNYPPSDRAWYKLPLEAKVRYFNDGLDVRIDTDYGILKDVFHQRVINAYEAELIPLVGWVTGVYINPMTKEVYSKKIHSLESRDKRNDRAFSRNRFSEDPTGEELEKRERVMINILYGR